MDYQVDHDFLMRIFPNAVWEEHGRFSCQYRIPIAVGAIFLICWGNNLWQWEFVNSEDEKVISEAGEYFTLKKAVMDVLSLILPVMASKSS